MKIISVVGLISFLILTGSSAYGQSSNRQDADDIDGRIVRIKGRVTIINHPELGVTPATFVGIVFRREVVRTVSLLSKPTPTVTTTFHLEKVATE